MECSLWRKLPDDLTESILTRLTVYDILRLRCVCDKFRALTSSHKFLKLYSQIPCRRPNLLMLAPFDLLGTESAYDPTLDLWLPLPLAFLQPFLQEFSYPVASNGGLLCLGSGREFVVCNPVTKSWKQLPKVPLAVQAENGQRFQVSFGEDFQQAFALTSDNTTGAFELTMINTSSISGTSKVLTYNSSTDLWKGQPELAMAEPRTLYSPKVVACNLSVFSIWKVGFSLVVYCFSKGLWTEIKGPGCSSTLLSSHLFDRYGSLYMVGGVGSVWLGDNSWERPTSMRIWELDIETKEWIERMRMSQSVLQEFHLHIVFDQLQCWAKDDILYMKSPGSCILMYDFCTQIWKWLERDMDPEFGAVFLEPSLSATA